MSSEAERIAAGLSEAIVAIDVYGAYTEDVQGDTLCVVTTDDLRDFRDQLARAIRQASKEQAI